jgi:hypothetical protein
MAAGGPGKDLSPVRGLPPGRDRTGCARFGLSPAKTSGEVRSAPPGTGSGAGGPP